MPVTISYYPAKMPLEIEIDDEARADLRIAGSRFIVWTRFVVTATDEPGLPYDALLRFELRERRFECRHLEVFPRDSDAPITLAGLRSIPIETLLRRTVELYGRRIFTEVVLTNQPSGAPKRGHPPVPRTGGPLGLPLPARRRNKRRGPDDDLGLAALVYEMSDMCGLPPTQAVADHLRIPLGTARDLVARARGRALLAPAPLTASIAASSVVRGTLTVTRRPPK